MNATLKTTACLVWLLAMWMVPVQAGAQNKNPIIGAPDKALIARLKLDVKFYKKYLDADGLAIVSSDSVSDYALFEARWIIDQMLTGREDIRRAIVSNNIRLAIMSPKEMTTAIPEHSDLSPAAYWDKRARGLGATHARPAVSCGEENLLEYPGDPYLGENILVHEFAHVIHQHGLMTLDRDFDKQLRSVFAHAIQDGLWKGKYAGSNHSEYFAEGVQSWFDDNRENDLEHNHVNTRDELKVYDPRLATLLESIFKDNDWSYLPPSKRKTGLQHLIGYQRKLAPRFVWPPKVSEAYQRHQSGAHLAQLKNLVDRDGENFKSVAGTKQVKITFRNRTADTVFFKWVDFSGKRIEYGRLDRGRDKQIQTFTGHYWEVSGKRGKLIGRFQAGDRDGLAELR